MLHRLLLVFVAILLLLIIFLFVIKMSFSIPVVWSDSRLSFTNKSGLHFHIPLPGGMGIYINDTHKPISVQLSGPVDKAKYEPSPTPQKVERLYKIALSIDPATFQEDDFFNFKLSRTLELESKGSWGEEIVMRIYFDTRLGSPYKVDGDNKYKMSYLLLTDKILDTNKIYEKDGLRVVVSDADKGLINYLKDPDYCEQESDCVIRENLCDYGSFNYYQEYHSIFGCGPAYYPEVGKDSRELEEENNCSVEVSYNSSKCISNRCVGEELHIQCIGDGADNNTRGELKTKKPMMLTEI